MDSDADISNFKTDIKLLEFLSDFTVVVDHIEFKTHKFLLASRSNYFRAMLFNNNTATRKRRVTLEDIKPDTMQTILDYFYTSRLIVNEDNLYDLLEAGIRFQLESISQLCHKFILKLNLDIINCLSVLKIAHHFVLDQAFDKTLAYCVENFSEIVKLDELSGIGGDLLYMLIFDERLLVSCQSIIFQAIIKWVECDRVERLPDLDRLMESIDFQKLTIPALMEISSNDCIKKSENLLRLVEEAEDQFLSVARLLKRQKRVQD